MRPARRRVAVAICGIVGTTDRCVKAVATDTGKVVNFPRRITDFAPGIAMVPIWFFQKISPSAGAPGKGLPGPLPDEMPTLDTHGTKV